ncbi:hypothetical protein ACFWOT_28575 [Streptomyces sp. NPDC058440]|uniref:hypothetical protein n=1 Tax=Streptomyces sp. NPDC058440 TaxID=3346501 RepID=UPI0036472619
MLPLVTLPGPFAAIVVVAVPGVFPTVVVACVYVTTDALLHAARRWLRPTGQLPCGR